MITEELKNLANGRQIEVIVEVNEREFEETRKRLEEEEASEISVKSCCVLPPKPSHEIVDRSEDVTSLLEEMKRLRNEKRNEITVVYLSGNPGCGKSEMARQIGHKFFLTGITKETSDLKLVFTFNASSLDTLIHSYIEFARALGCSKDSIAAVIKTENQSCVLRILQLKSLVTPKLKKYSSWLMIVDNVTDLELVSRFFLQKEENPSGNCQVLVTTQDSQSIVLNSYAYHLSLSAGMKPNDAVKMLTCIFTFSVEKEITLKVAKELDFQPLAMACAATYMRRVRSRESSMTWTRFLEQMNSGEQEEAEKSDIKRTYPAIMRAAVLMAVEKEMSDEIRMHVFHFLSVLAAKPVPLEYVIQYVTNCIPEKEKESVAASISTCSLLVKETGVHEVVHDCLQTLILNRKEENEIAVLVKVVETFLSCLRSYDSESSNFILDTEKLVVHFLALAERLKHCIKHYPSAQLMRKLSNRYAITSNALLLIGDICLIHGKHDAARICFETCLMIQDTFCGENYLPLAPTLNRLGKALCGIKHFEKARKCFERALTIEEIAYSKEHPALITTLNNIGTTLRDLGFAEEARKCFQRALKIGEIANGKEHPALAETLNNIGATLLDLGLANEAKRYFERVLTLIVESGRNEVDLIKAHALINLGDIFSGLGNYEKSKSCFERALNTYELIHNECHPTVVATLNQLGNTLRDLGEYQQAKKCLERVLSLDEQVYPEDHPVFATTLNNLGNTYRDLEQNTEAKRCFERALSILEITYNENHPLIASALCNLSLTLRDLGKHKEAKSCLERALTIQEMFLDENHPILAAIFTNLGLILSDLGQFKEAKNRFERAIAISETVYGENHPTLAVALKNLAFSFADLEQYNDAVICFERVFSIEEKINGNNYLHLTTTLTSFGDTFLSHGQVTEAKRWYERALAISERAPKENHPSLVTILTMLGETFRNLNQHGEAKSCFERVLAIAYETNHPALATTLNNLGNTFYDLQQYEEAENCFDRSLSIVESAYNKFAAGKRERSGAKKHLESELYDIVEEAYIKLGHLSFSGTFGLDVNVPEKYQETEEEFSTPSNQSLYDTDDLTLADMLRNLGDGFRDLGKDEKARRCFKKALFIYERVHGINHITLSSTLKSLGNIHCNLKQFEEAKKCFEKALAIDEKVYNNENHSALAVTLNNLGKTLRQLGELEEAKMCFGRALHINESLYDESNPAVADTMSNLGIILRDLGEYQQAKKCFERVLSIDEQVFTENHPALVATLNNLGNTLGDLGLYEEAIRCLERARMILDEAKEYESNQPSLAHTLCNLGVILRDLGRYEEAKKCLERALCIDESKQDINFSSLAATLVNLGLVHRDLGQLEEARKCWKRALSISSEEAHIDNHPTLVATLRNLGLGFHNLGQHEEAKICFENAKDIDESAQYWLRKGT